MNKRVAKKKKLYPKIHSYWVAEFEEPYIICDNCGYPHLIDTNIVPKRCPFCNAIMRDFICL